MTPDNVARLSASTSVIRSQRSIGAILVDAGKLSVEDAERVLKLQRQEKLLFGDAALKLKVVTQSEIDFALSRQFDYEYLQPGESRVSDSVIAAYRPFSAEVEAFRALRSQLMLRWFDGDTSRKILAVVSPEAKEGRSFIAANLAVVFAQLGERVLLVDADLRTPVQHALFGLDNGTGLSGVISGRQTTADTEQIDGFGHLSVLPAGPLPPNPMELLGRPGFPRLLDELKGRFDVILVDTPPSLKYADAQITAVRATGALVVIRKDASRAASVCAVSESLRSNTNIVGTVLNDY